jgi:hypothetical protein
LIELPDEAARCALPGILHSDFSWFDMLYRGM